MVADTRARVTTLAASGKYKTHKCVADEVGLSRERVRQILNEDGRFAEFGKRHLRMEWDCPDCGERISLARSDLEKLRHMPAHCRECAQKYCRRGLHLLSESRRGPGRPCRPCLNDRMRETVEVRACRKCHGELNISRAVQSRVRLGYTLGVEHNHCPGTEFGRRPSSGKWRAIRDGRDELLRAMQLVVGDLEDGSVEVALSTAHAAIKQASNPPDGEPVT